MTQREETIRIDLRQMILAIETAVSLVGMNDTNHGKRVGYIACQLAHQLGWSEADAQFAFELGLLHDCGVSTEQMHSGLVNHFDWKEAYIHCQIGYCLLKDFEPLAAFAEPLLYHHTHWQALQGLALPPRVAKMANLIFISDRVDVLGARHYESDILLTQEGIVSAIRSHAGTYFDPEMVEALSRLSQSEAFWIALENRHVSRYAWDMGLVESHRPLTLSQLRQLSLILAYIVDQKSPFTAEHSIRVADVAYYLAQLSGLPQAQCDKVQIAGLLHDLGKLHTPDQILEKPAPLDAAERAVMNHHSYETYEILRHIKGLDEVARWAAFHHEGINGAGYPFHPSERELSVEARIIAVADVFQAMVQNRPYRAGLGLADALAVLQEHVAIGKLDASLVGLIEQHGHVFFAIAQGADPQHNLNSIKLFPEEMARTCQQLPRESMA